MYYAVYDIEDNCVAVCNNYTELCSFFGKTKNSMQSSVSRFTHGARKQDKILNNDDHKYYKVYKYKENKK